MSPGITKFLQTSLYDPFLVVLFTKVLSLLKSLHNIPELWSTFTVYCIQTRAECWTGAGHQSPSLAISFHCSRILRREDSLPIDCIFVSLVDVGDPRGRAHDMVLNTGCCGIVIGVRVVHGHAETRGEIAFYVKHEEIHHLSKSLFTCYYFSVERVQFDVQSSEKWKIQFFGHFVLMLNRSAGCSINCTKHIKRSISGAILI